MTARVLVENELLRRLEAEAAQQRTAALREVVVHEEA